MMSRTVLHSVFVKNVFVHSVFVHSVRAYLWLFCFCMFFGSVASADPTREEVYRNDALKVVVYKDEVDRNIFWYIPPIQLYEQDGHIVYYKRARGDRTDYYLYIVPYMSDDLLNHLATEIPGVQNRAQLRPVIAKRFGIRIQQFDAAATSSEVTDFQYLNVPQLIRLSLDQSRAEDFEFFINNPPGVQAEVSFAYQAARLDRYITVELNCHDVYEALRIGVSGRYEFLRGEIEDAVYSYIAERNLNVRGRGDIPLPDIVTRAAMECFTPVPRPPRNPVVGVDQQNLVESMLLVNASSGTLSIEPLDQSVPSVPPGYVVPVFTGIGAGEVNPVPTAPPPSTPPPVTTEPGIGGPSIPSNPGGGGGGPVVPPRPPSQPTPPSPGPQPPLTNPNDGLMFYFRHETATSTRSFYFHREQMRDSAEVTAIPLLILMSQPAPLPRVITQPLPERTFLVAHTNEQAGPLRTGIQVGEGDQLLIRAVFGLFAESADVAGRRQYSWQSGWPSVEGDLYYRIGTGPWTPINGRCLIGSGTLQIGELQFYLERRRIWEKLPEDYRRSRWLGLVPAMFPYEQTYPQFSLTITGRHVTITRP